MRDATDLRTVAPEQRPEDVSGETSLRPKRFADYIGQDEIKANLKVFTAAALQRGEPLDHVLISGPPGLGKTTLAQILANEMGASIKLTSGPVLARAGDLAALLTNLESGDVLFLDEIHRLHPAVEEILYPAMEDGSLDLMIGEGPGARSVRIDLNAFTLIGATTRAGLLATPLRDRFGIPVQLDFYSETALTEIVERASRVLEMSLAPEGAQEIARRARGTPRIAGRLLRRVRDIAQVEGAAHITRDIADRALGRLHVDISGLDAMDQRYLQALVERFRGGPTGVDALAAALNEARDALEETVEPFLIRKGYVSRTPRGRVAEEPAYRFLGIARSRAGGQLDFGEEV